jgi:hypothetical protein
MQEEKPGGPEPGPELTTYRGTGESETELSALHIQRCPSGWREAGTEPATPAAVEQRFMATCYRNQW